MAGRLAATRAGVDGVRHAPAGPPWGELQPLRSDRYSAPMAQYVALLRGINVGGNNRIKMPELRRCFEALGLGNVATYIQSGNVLFEAAQAGPARLSARIEAALSERFGYQARIVLRSHGQMRAIVADAPGGFGSQPDLYRYDVVFLRGPLTAAEAMEHLRTKEGVDQAFAGDGVCYFARLASRAAQSYLSRFVALPVYQRTTIRNWHTTVKLQVLMDARGEGPRSSPRA
jgi:uncharacterized protein (DUF1697 family)